MKFVEKLERLISEQKSSRADIARQAGLKPTALGNYVNRNSEPLLRTALKLAKILKVPVEWLGDDDLDWPPPNFGASPKELSKKLGALMQPVAIRMIAGNQKAFEADWVAVAEALVSATETGRPLAAKFSDLIAIPRTLSEIARELDAFDPHGEIAKDTPPELLKEMGVLPGFFYSLLTLHANHETAQSQPGMAEVAHLSGALWIAKQFPSQFHEEAVARILAEVKQKLPELHRAKESDRKKLNKLLPPRRTKPKK